MKSTYLFVLAAVLFAVSFVLSSIGITPLNFVLCIAGWISWLIAMIFKKRF